jgi:hypothetical protein
MKVDDPMSTDETAESLVDRLATAGGWPDPRILTALLERREEAVEPLRAFIRRDFEDKNEHHTAISFAVDLLGSLGDASAIPDMFDLLRRYEDLDVVESVRETLRTFGTQVIETALEIARDRSLTSYPRDTAVRIAMEAAGDDLVARARVAEALREMLAEYINSDRETDEEDEMATYLVGNLADLADPLARDLIASAFQAEKVDPGMISPEDVEQSYLQGGETLPSGPGSWLPRYERAYEEHLERLRRMAEPRPIQPIYEPPAPEQTRPIPPPVETIRNTAPRPGRNDPCWCGSGKKYKKCHLLQDQG